MPSISLASKKFANTSLIALPLGGSPGIASHILEKLSKECPGYYLAIHCSREVRNNANIVLKYFKIIYEEIENPCYKFSQGQFFNNVLRNTKVLPKYFWTIGADTFFRRGTIHYIESLCRGNIAFVGIPHYGYAIFYKGKRIKMSHSCFTCYNLAKISKIRPVEFRDFDDKESISFSYMNSKKTISAKEIESNILDSDERKMFFETGNVIQFSSVLCGMKSIIVSDKNKVYHLGGYEYGANAWEENNYDGKKLSDSVNALPDVYRRYVFSSAIKYFFFSRLFGDKPIPSNEYMKLINNAKKATWMEIVKTENEIKNSFRMFKELWT